MRRTADKKRSAHNMILLTQGTSPLSISGSLEMSHHYMTTRTSPHTTRYTHHREKSCRRRRAGVNVSTPNKSSGLPPPALNEHSDPSIRCPRKARVAAHRARDRRRLVPRAAGEALWQAPHIVDTASKPHGCRRRSSAFRGMKSQTVCVAESPAMQTTIRAC